MTEVTTCTDEHREVELICVCCNCRRERTASDEWQEHHPVKGERLTHGICPACLDELYPEIAPLIRQLA
jgi:hypothetical protein